MSVEEKNLEIEEQPIEEDDEKEIQETDEDDDVDDDDIEEDDNDVPEDDDDETDDDADDDEESPSQVDKLQKGKRTATKNMPTAENTNLMGNVDTFNDPDDQLESDDDDEYTEDIFKKLESSFNDDITFVHPQTTEVNNNELKNLSTIVRNKYGIIVDVLHRTVPILSKYEYTKILGQRVTQLNNGYKSFITREGHIDNTSIAEEEIRRKLVPVIIRRPLWSGASEYWLLSDLEILR